MHQRFVAGIGGILFQPVKGIFVDRDFAADLVIFVLLDPDQLGR